MHTAQYSWFMFAFLVTRFLVLEPCDTLKIVPINLYNIQETLDIWISLSEIFQLIKLNTGFFPSVSFQCVPVGVQKWNGKHQFLCKSVWVWHSENQRKFQSQKWAQEHPYKKSLNTNIISTMTANHRISHVGRGLCRMYSLTQIALRT